MAYRCEDCVMAARWSAEERKTLKSLLEDGVELNLLKEHLPDHRTHNAIHREAQKYGYGVHTSNGIKRLYFGKRTRNRKKRDEEAEMKPTVEEARTAVTIQEPIASERTTENFSDVIVPDITATADEKVKEAVEKSMDTLLTCGIPLDLKIIHELSSHILSSKR